MDDTKFQSILSLVRVCIISVGGIFVHKGVVDNDTLQLIVGAAAVVGPALWAVWSNFHQATKAQVREVAAVNVGVAHANETEGLTPPVPAAEAKALIQQSNNP